MSFKLHISSCTLLFGADIAAKVKRARKEHQQKDPNSHPQNSSTHGAQRSTSHVCTRELTGSLLYVTGAREVADA